MTLRVNNLTGFGGGGDQIVILLSDLGNVNSTHGATATFASVAVGSSGGRTLIVMATIEDDAGSDTAEVNSCTVDGNACTRRVEVGQGASGGTAHAAVFTRALTTEIGNVDIVLGGNTTPDSWGMSFIIVTGMQSETPTDSAVGISQTSPVTTSTTLDGISGGIAIGVAAHSSTATHTWGSSLTERADVSTGGDPVPDHRHSVGYDLLPSGRSASTETVTGGTNRFALATVTFR